ncbi:MAG: penicillin-binding protein 2 [Magnetococcales bacterium]|nr:penicillin-binding protein 2 [Magnetococcales bacterium]
MKLTKPNADRGSKTRKVTRPRMGSGFELWARIHKKTPGGRADRGPSEPARKPPLRPAAAAGGSRSGGGPAGRPSGILGSREAEPHFLGRLDFVLGMFLLAFAILAVRAVDLTVLQGDRLRTRAANQHNKKVVVPASRGRILDRGNRTLATTLPVKNLSLDRDRLDDPAKLAKRLAPLLGTSVISLEARLRRIKPGTFPVLKRKISPEVARQIEQLDHPSLFFLPAFQRFYPLGEITSHIIGFVDVDGKGVEGLEHSFDATLQGQPGTRLIVRDRLGRPMPMGQTLDPARAGTDLVLTIDTTIQYVAYRALLKAMQSTQANAGTVVILDPTNGNILALVNQPSFNPNNLSASRPNHRRNRAIMDTFEPGSTFKIFTIAAALDQGVVQADTLFDVENGTFRVADRIIRDTHKYQMLTVGQILQKSSNVGAAKVGIKMGHLPQEQYLHKFGFGRPTGIDLAFESVGRIPDITHFPQVGLATRSFGQGISATPLQLITAVSASINGGMLYSPRLVEGRMVDGRMEPQPRPDPFQVISPKTSKIIRDILVGVVGPEGTAPKARVDGYTAGGKTGTAQKAGKGGYAAGKYFASFVGFVPADQPRLVVFVGIDEPVGNYYGGLVAAPVFREISQEVLPLMAVLPETPQSPPLPAIAGRVFNPELPGQAPGPAQGPGSAQGPGPGSAAQGRQQLPGQEQQGTSALIGTSLGEALDFLREQGIIPQVEGNGLVVAETPLPEGGLRLKLE